MATFPNESNPSTLHFSFRPKTPKSDTLSAATAIIMMAGIDVTPEINRKGIISQAWTRVSQIYQGTLDQWTPHTRMRWVGSAVLLLLFIIRIVTKQGWYIVTYALGIYHLNLFIAFLSPKIDPAMDFDAEDENGPALPTRSTEEFRPFIRRLPEFKFWLSVTKSTLIAIVCTFIEAFNIPVFWPILVMYFITLFCITMKRQIKHMIKYRYLPFTHSKPKYKTVESTVTVN